MKLTKNTREQIKPLLEKLIDWLGKPFVVHCYQGNKTNTAFDLWHKLYCNINYDDNNPNVIFVSGKRLFVRNTGFLMYPDNTNDDTLKTGLLKVISEIIY